MQNALKKMLVVAGGVAALAAPAFGQAATTANQRWQIRFVVERFFDVAEGGGLASVETWQTSWNGASWSTFSVISTTGDASSKQNIGRVDITYQGRVGIVGQNEANPGDSTRPQNQRNYGVNRLGGSGSVTGTGFFLRFTDPSTYTSALVSPHRLERAATGETRGGNGVNDTSGNPVAGTFMPFRVGFTPTGAPFAQGSNTDGNNGAISNPASGLGAVTLANLTGARGSNFGGDGTASAIGVAQLDETNSIVGGDFANFYKMSYFPKPDYSNVDSQVYRRVTLAHSGGSNTNPRYLFAAQSPTNYSSGNGPNFPGTGIGTGSLSINFFVPTPGAAALAGLAAVAGLRRRRA
jgi:hypothetical protein